MDVSFHFLVPLGGFVGQPRNITKPGLIYNSALPIDYCLVDGAFARLTSTVSQGGRKGLVRGLPE
jgi:hypothetical protein